MLSRTINIIRISMCGNARTFYCVRNILQSNFLTHDNSIKGYDVQNHNLYMVKRFKSNRRKIIDDKKNKEDSDEEEEEDEEEAPIGSKIITINVASIRLDTISKAGFGISRTKIEEAFYASKLRINGKKVFKKSIEMEVGDEIDMILHRDLDNPALLLVNRILILSMSPLSNSIRIKLSCDKKLLIEDYEEPWSGA